MDKNFWENFYKTRGGRHAPSPFSHFCSTLINTGPLFEIGCGNGADAFYFANRGIITFACDQCVPSGNFYNPFFIEHNFGNLPQYNMAFDTIYSRFSLHSSTVKNENRALRWSYEHLNKHGLICIEARSTKDKMYGQGKEVGHNAFMTDHYRRFIDQEEMCNKLSSYGFKTTYVHEGRGFSPYKNEDPVCIRVIGEKA